MGLSNYLSSHEKKSTKDRNKSTICFTSSNTLSNSRYSSKTKMCRKITCHPLVISGIPKTSGSKYGFQIKFRISVCCQREWRCHTQKGRDS
ncbi:30S ribosomal protein s7 chloroplastic [Phtheirospermum japonicum]|uniref:30S ribosomal protein s7 chloroplastic n=1 Tax=Phtheirospermum japonicum TaxID=374723 RepID=A0A830D1I0_9LAMI|nr:30S ribosomal protein s7 chloroplastic [Phtheirospermum japonicum]